jgi:hypothetical protein
VLGTAIGRPELVGIQVRMGVQGNAVWTREVVMFDTIRGLMLRREGEYHMASTWRWTGAAIAELVNAEILVPAQLEQLRNDMTTYFAVSAKCAELAEQMHQTPTLVDSLSRETESLLVRAKARVEEPLVRQTLDYDIARYREHTARLRQRE